MSKTDKIYGIRPAVNYAQTIVNHFSTEDLSYDKTSKIWIACVGVNESF